MGRKDVPKNTGSGCSAKPGVPTVFQCIERNQNTRYSEDMLFYRTNMRRTTYRFCTWKRKTQKPGYNVQIGVDSENILSEKGILYRMNRSIQVEGAFGVLKNDYEFQRFLLRGKTKVKLEILLLCMGYNLNKLHAKIQNERTGSHLFPVKETA